MRKLHDHRARASILLTLSLYLLVTPAAFAEAKNCILFIGDGMGLAHVTAARIYAANARDGRLAIDALDHTALVRTYSANAMVTDSAAAGTALATGYKTNNEAISVAPGPEGAPLGTILELARKAGKSVGIVTTSRVTDATPAAFYAHAPSRRAEDQIAGQLIAYGQVDVVMGGGKRYFMTEQQTDGESGKKGSRKDGIDLLERARSAGYRVVERQGEFDRICAETDSNGEPIKLLGLFSEANMAYEAERAGDQWGEPSIAEMTRLAIRILERNPKGYFLMVEGGRIDHAAHDNRGIHLVNDLLAFDAAVKLGADAAKEDKETLIVVTADHETAGLAINGYTSIDIGGENLLTASTAGGKDILSFASGPGADRAASAEREKADPDYRQPALYQAPSAFHTAVDVIAWATGPGAENFRGTIDNTDVAKIIMRQLFP